MIDIIEAGKFYNDCLKTVRLQEIKDEVARKDLFNEVIKCEYKIYNLSHLFHEYQLIFSFVLNGTTFADTVNIDEKATPPEIIKAVSKKVGEIITARILG